MVKSNTQNKSYATNAHSPGPQLPLLVLVSLQTHSILFLVPALGLVNAFIPEDTLVLVALSDTPGGASEEEESEEEEVSPGPRTPTTSRIITGKLSHRIAPLQLPAASSPSAPEGRTYSMSWDDQVSAEESRGLASGVICAPQAPLSTSLMPHGPNHGTAESSSEIEGGSAVAGICDVTAYLRCHNP